MSPRPSPGMDQRQAAQSSSPHLGTGYNDCNCTRSYTWDIISRPVRGRRVFTVLWMVVLVMLS
jgi:hypothetical protein